MSDERTVKSIREGDERALAAVMGKYARLLWTVADGVLAGIADEQDVEECVADAFIKLWSEPEKFDPGRGSLKSWLCMVTRSRALDKYRELNRRCEQPMDEALLSRSSAPEDRLLREERNEALNRALDTLPEQDRDILLRRYARSQKPREIAAALGLPVKEVKNRLYRSKLRLKSLILRQNGGIE